MNFKKSEISTGVQKIKVSEYFLKWLYIMENSYKVTAPLKYWSVICLSAILKVPLGILAVKLSVYMSQYMIRLSWAFQHQRFKVPVAVTN